MGWTQAYSGSFPRIQDRLLSDVSGVKREDPLRPCAVLVGSNLLRLWIQDRLAETEAGWIQIRCVTFLDWAQTAAGQVFAGQGMDPLASGCETLLMAQALAGCREHLSVLGEEEGEGPLLEVLVTTWKELREAGWKEWHLLHKLGSKGKDLSILFSEFERMCGEARVYTRQDLLEKATETPGPWPFLCPGPVFVYGFYDLQALQRRLLDGIAKSHEVRIYLPDFRGAGRDYAKGTRQWVEERVRIESLESSPGKSGRPSWRALSAPHRSAEVRELLREVLRLVEEEGVAPGRIAILLREDLSYRGLFKDTLDQMADQGFALPYRFVPGATLIETREARSLLWLLELAAGDLPRAEVMEFAQFAPLNLPEEDRPGVSLWEPLSCRAGIHRGLPGWKEGLSTLRLALEMEVDRRQTEGEAWGCLPMERQALDGLIAWFDRWIEARDAIQKAQDDWEGLAEAVSRAASSLLLPGETLDRCLETVEALAEMDGVFGPCDMHVFHEALKQSMQALRLLQDTHVGEGLLIAQVMDARGLRFHTVMLPGMTQGVFPMKPSQDPLLSDADRGFLQDRVEEPMLRERFRRRREEEALFEMAQDAAREGLLLSYPRFEEGGSRPLLPSSFLLRMLKEDEGRSVGYGEVEFSSRVTRLPASRPEPNQPERSLTPSEYDRSCLRRSEAKRSGEASAYLLERYPNFARSMELVRERLGKPVWTRFDGIIRGVIEPGELLPMEAISPTRLESYASCPFQYFLDVVLRVGEEEGDEQEPWPSALDRGILVHGVLERFWRELRDQGKRLADLPAKQWNERLQALVRETASEFHGSWSMRSGWKMSLASLLDHLREHLLWERDLLASWRPFLFEASFGPGRKAEVSLNTQAGTVRFQGRIDRLDRGEQGGFRVVDYKSGGKRSASCEVGTGQCLQLPVYLLAGAALLGSTPQQGEALYLYVGLSPAGQCVLLSGSSWEKIEREMAHAVSVLLRGIRDGFFPALPSGQCERSCPYRDACHGRDQALERKAKDKRIQELLRLREGEGE